MVTIEGPFQAQALRVLRELPDLTVVAKPGGRARSGVDAILRFADNNRAPVAVEFKRDANPATAWQLVHYAHTRPNLPLLLVAERTTAAAREILQDHGIAVIDGLGNAHIELPGLLFHMNGQRRPQATSSTTPPTRLRGKAGVVAQALLLHPERVWQVNEVANQARVSAALAHRVLTRLEGEEIVTTEGTGPKRVRRVTNATALLDLWAEETFEQPVRTLGYVLAQTPQQLIKKLGANLGRSGIDYALTGAAAASLVAPMITAVPVVDVWVTSTAAPEELRAAGQADRVTDGHNVVFLQGKDDTPLAFREHATDLWVANRFRLYADLRRDPRRGREQADHLRREVIGF